MAALNNGLSETQMRTFSDWPWRHWARQRAEACALRQGQRTLSWSQLTRQIDELAAGFIRQGIHAGCGVVLQADSSEQAVLAYLALLQCGARLLPLNPQLPASQTDFLPSLNIDFALTLKGDPPAGIAALQRQPRSGTVRHEWQMETIATLTLTSGSSGRPKAAAHTFKAHLASAQGVVEKMGFTAADSWLLSLPLYHVSGQGILWRWLSVGGGLALTDGATLSASLARCSFASLVPTQLWRLLQQPLPTQLRTVLLGGAAISPALTQQAEAQGIACWCGYGMTETASTIAAKRASATVGVGTALAGHRIRLVAGEVQLQSAALACGYWQNGELLPLVDEDGWFHTRDGGHWVAGELQLTGRLDNQFFSAGEGIQPEQVEAVLAAHPAVDQVFIVPKKDEEYGHRPVALVAIKPELSLSALEAWAAPRLAGFQRPVRWYLLPELDSGGIKISRRQLINWVAQQEKGR